MHIVILKIGEWFLRKALYKEYDNNTPMCDNLILDAQRKYIK